METAWSVSMLTGVTGTGIGFTAAARKAGPTATTARSDGPVVKEQIGHQDQCGTMNSPDLLFKSCKVRLALGKAALE